MKRWRRGGASPAPSAFVHDHPSSRSPKRAIVATTARRARSHHRSNGRVAPSDCGVQTIGVTRSLGPTNSITVNLASRRSLRLCRGHPVLGAAKTLGVRIPAAPTSGAARSGSFARRVAGRPAFRSAFTWPRRRVPRPFRRSVWRGRRAWRARRRAPPRQVRPARHRRLRRRSRAG